MKSFIIESINRIEPTQRMIDAGMTNAQYLIGVQGDYPRSDKPGYQCVISISERALASKLKSIGYVSAKMNLDQAVAWLYTDSSWIQDFIDGHITGVEYHKAGTEYKLTAQSRECRDNPDLIGEVRVTKNNNFVLNYNNWRIAQSAENKLMNKIAEKQAKSSALFDNLFGGMFGGATAVDNTSGTVSNSPVSTDNDVEIEPEKEAKEWGDTLESMVEYIDENELRASFKNCLKQDGTLKAGKTVADVEAILVALED